MSLRPINKNLMLKTATKTIVLSLVLLISACGGGGGGGGGGCNIVAGQLCDIGQYCAYSDNSCGKTGASGTCTAIPLSCPAEGPAVCTCDSLTFNNQCLAAQSGQSIQAVGECA